MTKITITHNIQGCIGCGACEAVCSENWAMKEIDGEIKAVVIKATISDDTLDINKEAAECCPVNVIHLHDDDNDKQII